MNLTLTVCDDRDVQALPNQSIDLPASLAMILPRVLQDDGCIPVDRSHQFEWRATLSSIPRVLGWTERQPHLIYRYSKKLKMSSATP
jgi:hypothetical protein